MRTTLNIDDTVYSAVKELAAQNRDTIGNTISKLVEDAILRRSEIMHVPRDFPALPEPATPRIVTTEEINALREKLGI